jgi:hypothetical protein
MIEREREKVYVLEREYGVGTVTRVTEREEYARA